MWLHSLTDICKNCIAAHYFTSEHIQQHGREVLCLSVQGSCSVPLGIAAEKGYSDIVKQLLKSGALVDYENQVCNTSFSGSFIFKKSLFIYTQHGCSAIFYAAKKGHKVVVEILIKSGANLNAEHEVKWINFIYLQIKW